MIIPHNSPYLDEKEIVEVGRVINSGWIAEGEETNKFEKKISNFLGSEVNIGVATSSGSSALYIALKALGVKAKDEVIMPTYVCSALLNAVYMVGATPILVDVLEQSFNINESIVKKYINEQTKAIIVPHTFGIPKKLDEIKKLGIPIIEDCAQALGAKIDGQYVGIFGDISIFSFYASKVITTGQGGMIISKNTHYYNKIRDYIEHDGRESYIPRFNFQMTDVQAAMGNVQMNKIEEILKYRQDIAKAYIEVCNEKGWDYQKNIDEKEQPNWYRFIIKQPKSSISKLSRYLEYEGIRTIIPIESNELLHNYLKINRGKFPIAEEISINTISLPIYPKLIRMNQMEKVIETLRRY